MCKTLCCAVILLSLYGVSGVHKYMYVCMGAYINTLYYVQCVY